ncbi:hypothetical protein [Paenarthrobacter histidinolovorans]|uniref:hypothetical protein n=1 Tax=Paenarthrobacter histidinolovorans TaxID=43664 RepID=UPI001667737C|nr:hypothetical protein [Paenarthrobacter histidinolovorans]GGJ20362.1 hypothetical protein GCM10010052_17100 [Paenarthrobacter histidinolovorans]
MTNYFAPQGSLTRGDVFVDEDGTIYTVVKPLVETGEMTLIKGSIADLDRADYTVTKSEIQETSRVPDFDVLVLHKRTTTENKGF